MALSHQEPGIIVSGVAHAALIVAGLVAISSAPPFAAHEEAIAVEVISETQLSTLAKGAVTAKEVVPEPKPRVDKVAAVSEEKPDPVSDKRDVPVPPSRPHDVETAEREVVAPARQQKAQPIKQADEAPKAEPDKPDERIPDPPKRPVTEKLEEKRKAVEKTDTKLEGKQLAKLIEETKREEKPKAKPAEPSDKVIFSDIKQLLASKEKQQSSGSKGQELNRTVALGTTSGSSQKMSVSQRDALNGLVRSCIMDKWNVPPPSGTLNFQLHVRMSLKPDGSLLANPEMANTSPDPAFRPWAASLTRAILQCSPFRIPAQYDAFYADWRDWNILFDPKDFQG